MKAEDIGSADDLEAWLNGLPEDQALQVAPQIAHRAAMRVLPFWAEYCARSQQDDLTALPVFRCSLLNAVSHEDRTAFEEFRLRAATVRARADARADARANAASAYRASARASAAADAAASASASASARASARASASAAAAYLASAFASASAFAASARANAAAVEKGADLTKLPLWPDGADPLAVEMVNAAPLFERHPAWQVFKDLYENTLHARPQNMPLLIALAKKDTSFWTGTDTEVLDRIAGVMEEFAVAEEPDHRLDSKTRLTAASLMRAAIADFKLNDIRHLLEMVPFPEDVEQFSDPADLAAFLSEAQGLIRSMETLKTAFEREGRAMQGAGSMFVYLDAIVAELSSVRQTSSLNVGWVIECGDILQSYSLNADIVAEIGALNMPLRRVVERLSKLIAGHFASTLLRFAPLRDIKSSEDTSLGDFMTDLRRGLEVIADTSDNSRIPLAPEAIEVFEKLLAAVEKTIKAEFLAPDTKTKGSIRKEADFLIAQVMVSMMLYWEKAKSRSSQAVTVADELGKIGRGVNGLETLWRLFKDFFFP